MSINVQNIKSVTTNAMNPLGDIQIIDGKTYQYCSFASGSRCWAGEAVKISAAYAAARSSENRISGVAAASVDATSAAKYAWVQIGGQTLVRYGVALASQIAAATTASASLASNVLVSTGTAASASAAGAVKLGGFTYATTGTTAVSASEIQTLMLELSARSESNLLSNGIVSAYPSAFAGESDRNVDSNGMSKNAYYMADYVSASAIISATAAPISAYLSIGDIIEYNGVKRWVLAVPTGSAEVTAMINSAFGATGGLTATASGWTASAGALTGFYLGAYRAQAMFI